jgi:hypothetical protein
MESIGIGDHDRDGLRGNSMLGTRRWLAGALLAGGALLAACSGGSDAAATHEEPATVEDVAGQADIKLVTLTDEAVKHIGLETATVTDGTDAGGNAQKVIPFAALIYAPDGTTFVYTSAAGNKFMRAPVTVTRIAGEQVSLSDGPPTGTAIVTVGAAELLGTERGVGED